MDAEPSKEMTGKECCKIVTYKDYVLQMELERERLKLTERSVKNMDTQNVNYQEKRSYYKPGYHIDWNAKSLMALVLCIFIPLLLGGVASQITNDAAAIYEEMIKPPLSPPASAFPKVWAALYLMMGIASFYILNADPETKKYGRGIYIIQLVMNFGWSLIFFGSGAYWFAALWLLGIIMMLVALITFLYKAVWPATLWLIPYLLWCMYAFYLNVAIALLNWQ